MKVNVLFLFAAICGTLVVGQEQETTMTTLEDTICPSRMVQEKNKETVREFMQALFGDKDVEAVDKYIDPNVYIQHNPNVADGRDALKTAAKVWFKDAEKEKVDILRMAADGDLVWLHMKAKRGGKVEAIMDIFRLKDYKIVEHWDVHQDLPEKSENSHPLF